MGTVDMQSVSSDVAKGARALIGFQPREPRFNSKYPWTSSNQRAGFTTQAIDKSYRFDRDWCCELRTERIESDRAHFLPSVRDQVCTKHLLPQDLGENSESNKREKSGHDRARSST
jgi:hypothetical protein